MHAPHLLLLERTLDPVGSELVRLGLLGTFVMCVALIAIGACMLAANVCAAWRAACSPASCEEWPARAPRIRPMPPAPRIAVTGPSRRTAQEPAWEERRHSLRLIGPDVHSRESCLEMEDT
jgi:hypothetical protein